MCNLITTYITSEADPYGAQGSRAPQTPLKIYKYEDEFLSRSKKFQLAPNIEKWQKSCGTAGHTNLVL